MDLRLRRTGPQLGQRASTASLVPRSALASRGARLLLRLLQGPSRAASVIPDASEDSLCRDRTLSQNLLAHHRLIARGVSSLTSEAREEAHAAGASGLRATWDAASTACLVPRGAPAPAARGSSLQGDSSRCDQSESRHLRLAVEGMHVCTYDHDRV